MPDDRQPPAADSRLARLDDIPRLREEKETLEYMVLSYCRRHHRPSGTLCPNCADFLAYALRRLACCPYGKDKPVCAKCRIHCYKPQYKEAARAVMREEGPRLVLTHPVLAAKHLWYSCTVKAPEKPRNRNRN